jgi:hypothetical protein
MPWRVKQWQQATENPGTTWASFLFLWNNLIVKHINRRITSNKYKLLHSNSVRFVPDKQLQESATLFQQICQLLHVLYPQFHAYYSINSESDAKRKNKILISLELYDSFGRRTLKFFCLGIILLALEHLC